MMFVRCKYCEEEIYTCGHDDDMDSGKIVKLKCHDCGLNHDYHKSDRRKTITNEVRSEYKILERVSKTINSSYNIFQLMKRRHPRQLTVSLILWLSAPLLSVILGIF